jgi:hypothetical protein
MRYLALSHVNLDADKEIHLTSPCDVALEDLCLRGVSPGVIKILTKTLSNSADAPPTLCKLALTPTLEEGFAEAVAELIIACRSHLTSLAWLPSIHFRESTLIENRSTADKYSSFLPWPNQHIRTPPPPLHHHISILNPPKTTIRPNPLPPTSAFQSPQHPRKNHPRMSLRQEKPYIRKIPR